jgi:hypothetical protein
MYSGTVPNLVVAPVRPGTMATAFDLAFRALGDVGPKAPFATPRPNPATMVVAVTPVDFLHGRRGDCNLRIYTLDLHT